MHRVLKQMTRFCNTRGEVLTHAKLFCHAKAAKADTDFACNACWAPLAVKFNIYIKGLAFN